MCVYQYIINIFVCMYIHTYMRVNLYLAVTDKHIFLHMPSTNTHFNQNGCAHAITCKKNNNSKVKGKEAHTPWASRAAVILPDLDQFSATYNFWSLQRMSQSFTYVCTKRVSNGSSTWFTRILLRIFHACTQQSQIQTRQSDILRMHVFTTKEENLNLVSIHTYICTHAHKFHLRAFSRFWSSSSLLREVSCVNVSKSTATLTCKRQKGDVFNASVYCC